MTTDGDGGHRVVVAIVVVVVVAEGAWSAGSKCGSPQKRLTSWRAKDRGVSAVQMQLDHRSHTLPGGLRTGIIRRDLPPGKSRKRVVSKVQIQSGWRRGKRRGERKERVLWWRKGVCVRI